MKNRNRSLIYYLTMDLPILVGAAVVIFFIELGIIPFHKSGYYCQDQSLNFVFIRDTISMHFIFISVVSFPFLVLWPVEAFLYRPSEYSIKTKRWLESLKSASLWYREFFYGLCMNLMVVEIMKATMGNPRPTFLDICEPDNRHTCTKGAFVYNFTCTSTKYSKWFTQDASRSFPSGHTSLSVHVGLFVAWYLQRRAFSWRNRTVFLVPLMQMLCLTYSIVCSLTRITDNRHHWWDVLTGAVIGVLSAAYSVKILCKNFTCPTAASSSDISTSDISAHNHTSVRRLLSSGSSSDHTHSLPHAHIAHVP